MKNIIFVVALLAGQSIVAQNVGIGTTSPQTQLHINNATTNSIIRAETNKIAGEASLELKTGPNPFDFLELRKWMTGNGGTLAGIPLNGLSTISTGMNTTGGLLIGTKPPQPFYFTTDNIERMRISAAGNIGAGATPDDNVRLRVVTQDGYHAIVGQTNFIPPTGFGYISSINGLISNSAVNGAGVSGSTTLAGGGSAIITGGMYGVLGTAVEQGYGIGAFGVTGAGGIYSRVITGSGKALRTFGPVQFEAIGAATGNVLTSDALGNASWQNPATAHNHFGQTWLGTNSFSGLVIQNSSAISGSTGITVSSLATQGTGVYGVSTGDRGVGVRGFVDHGVPNPPHEVNSALVGVNTSGNGLYATSDNGFAIKAVKLNGGPTVTGPVVLFKNEKTTNTSPVLLLQNGATNPTALELNNGYIKVSGANKTAFVHTTTAGNISANLSVLNYPNAAATDMLFVTHNYSPVNTYFNYNYGVYWNGAAWTIYIEAHATPMPVNINFNVMVIKQ